MCRLGAALGHMTLSPIQRGDMTRPVQLHCCRGSGGDKAVYRVGHPYISNKMPMLGRWTRGTEYHVDILHITCNECIMYTLNEKSIFWTIVHVHFEILPSYARGEL